MHVNIRNWICNYSINLFKLEKIETENILIDKKNYKDLVIYFTMLTVSQ